ncbi:rRNA maturation RNase YbeY [Desulfuromonas acetoxidans]|uniref:rRNA maturation RNase YbeY n=1 Tax=Desulfuromonas acetoxidans TaxID=891 RepID=UPI0029311C27|nr:rRNA maturation RNase YbeY [Desulfuromonas acetoxidans]
MIYIENQQQNHDIPITTFKTAARTILNALECPEDTELSVVIVDDDQIQEINRDYLQRDNPTNVISFAQQEGEGAGICPELLGDVVISADTAARDAAEAGVPFFSEMSFLLIHGILHLLGYDHERGTEEQAAEMEAKERELFAVLKQAFPELITEGSK